MCYSERISLLTFLTGSVFSMAIALRKNRNYTILGGFLLFVSLMQGIEYLLWRHPVCDQYNKNISILGMILNHAQPVVLSGLLIGLGGRNVPILLGITAIYLLTIIPYSFQFLTEESLQCTTTQSNDPHLVWNWNTLKGSKFVYGIFLASFALLFSFGMPDANRGLLYAVVSVLTYMTSSLFYDRKVMGALWCFYTSFIPALVYFCS